MPQLAQPAVGQCPFGGKQGWASKFDAEQSVKALRLRLGSEVRRVYHCPCGLWHVSSHRRGKRR